MNNIQKQLVLTAAKTSPKLFNLIAQTIDMGSSKEGIMNAVLSAAPQWSVTAGLCDAVCDFFLSDEGRAIIQKAKQQHIARYANRDFKLRTRSHINNAGGDMSKYLEPQKF